MDIGRLQWITMDIGTYNISSKFNQTIIAS